jgi:hypothetical protein
VVLPTVPALPAVTPQVLPALAPTRVEVLLSPTKLLTLDQAPPTGVAVLLCRLTVAAEAV